MLFYMSLLSFSGMILFHLGHFEPKTCQKKKKNVDISKKKHFKFFVAQVFPLNEKQEAA